MATSTGPATSLQSYESPSNSISYGTPTTSQLSASSTSLDGNQNLFYQSPASGSEKGSRGGQQRLVCPCHAYDPNKYSAAHSARYRSCAVGFPDINRLKEHLGYYGDKKGRHCRVRNGRFRASADITEAQFNSIKYLLKRGMSAFTAWNTIFEVLYPHVKPIPSPYVVTTTNRPQPQVTEQSRSWIEDHKQLLAQALLPKLDAILGPIQEPYRAACISALNEAVSTTFDVQNTHKFGQTSGLPEQVHETTRVTALAQPERTEMHLDAFPGHLAEISSLNEMDMSNSAERLEYAASDGMESTDSASLVANVTPPSIFFPSPVLNVPDAEGFPYYEQSHPEGFNLMGFDDQLGEQLTRIDPMWE